MANVNPRIDRIDSCGSNRLRRTGSSMEDFVFEVNQIPGVCLNYVLCNGESELFGPPEFSESLWQVVIKNYRLCFKLRKPDMSFMWVHFLID